MPESRDVVAYFSHNDQASEHLKVYCRNCGVERSEHDRDACPDLSGRVFRFPLDPEESAGDGT